MRSDEKSIRRAYNTILELWGVKSEPGRVIFHFGDKDGNNDFIHFQVNPTDLSDEACQKKATKYLNLICLKSKLQNWQSLIYDCIDQSFTIADDLIGNIYPVHVVERIMKDGKIYKDVDQIYTNNLMNDEIILFKKTRSESILENEKRKWKILEAEQKNRIKDEEREKRARQKEEERRRKFENDKIREEIKSGKRKFTLNRGDRI